MRSILAPILLSAAAVGCGAAPENQPADVQGLELAYAPSRPDSQDCRPERVARIDKDRHEIYMVRGEIDFTSPIGDARSRIPLQIQFQALNGVQQESITSLPELGVPCDAVQIDIAVEACIDHQRQEIECPNITLSGQAHFAGLTIQPR